MKYVIIGFCVLLILLALFQFVRILWDMARGRCAGCDGRCGGCSGCGAQKRS